MIFKMKSGSNPKTIPKILFLQQIWTIFVWLNRLEDYRKTWEGIFYQCDQSMELKVAQIAQKVATAVEA